MRTLNSHLYIDTKDSATSNYTTFDNIRISVITSRLIRVEISKNGEFIDQATQKVWYRDFEKAEYTISEKDKNIVVTTDNVILTILKNGILKSVQFIGGKKVTEFKKGNLKGTCRTLDGTIGEVKLEDGVVSKNGVAILDDSDSILYDNDGKLCENTFENRDYYIFAYGNCYRQAIIDFYKLTGQTPLIPRYALGNWWSRYHAYTDKEYLKVMDDFIKRDIPITVATVDMDWHLVNGLDNKYRTGNIYLWESTGWTGYTWNSELFPDYKQFLVDLHNRNLAVTLNLHPARGVRGFETMYEEMAQAVGVNAEKEEPVDFDLTNDKFVNNYFDIVHHPYEEEGVDFWWIDWQQGKQSKMKGLDPLYALNHYHTLDSGRGEKRGLILSRYAGIGSHRYPLGFSGDTNTTWACLKFQPYFTLTATNCGYSWWSHDIGGHHFGEKNDELYCRWVQFGVFSPIMRLHSSSSDIMGKEPWNYSGVTENVVADYMRLRHAMIPFIYTMNMRTHRDGIALIEPLYYDYPEDKRAYECRNAYIFGKNLIVAPISKQTDKRTLTAGEKVFLPKGRWTDIFTGKVYNGDCCFEANRDISKIPVFAKEGTILPLATDLDKLNSTENPKTLKLLVYQGNGDFTLFEDDGVTNNYKNGAFVTRNFAVKKDNKDIEFNIQPAVGDKAFFTKRKFIIEFKDIVSFAGAKATLNEKSIDLQFQFNGDNLKCEIEIEATDLLQINFTNVELINNGSLRENIIQIFSKYQRNNNAKTSIYNLFKGINTKSELKSALNKHSLLLSYNLKSVLSELLYMEFD